MGLYKPETLRFLALPAQRESPGSSTFMTRDFVLLPNLDSNQEPFD